MDGQAAVATSLSHQVEEEQSFKQRQPQEEEAQQLREAQGVSLSAVTIVDVHLVASNV